MGASQSVAQRRERKPSSVDGQDDAEMISSTEFVRLEPEDIPDEYKSIGVSDEVIRRVNQQQTPDQSVLSLQLSREREQNELLRQQMAALRGQQETETYSAAVSAATAAAKTVQMAQQAETFEEKKRVFDEAVTRVKKQFLSRMRENTCADIEEEIVRCLNANRKTVLNCHHLLAPYRSCVDEFRARVIREEVQQKKAAASAAN